jgi:hypothetical protein
MVETSMNRMYDHFDGFVCYLKIKKKQKRKEKRTRFLIGRGNEVEMFNVKMGVLGNGAQEERDITMEREQ